MSGKKLVDYSNSGNATVSQSLLERVRRLPDVEAASGAFEPQWPQKRVPSGFALLHAGHPHSAISDSFAPFIPVENAV